MRVPGKVRTVLTERDRTWVDVVNDVVWLDGGKKFTWVSERDGWNHVYAVSRDGKSVRLVTRGTYDVLEVEGIDGKGGWLYYVASPDNPTQRYLFRTRLDGKGKPERLSPRNEPGTHTYDRAPNFRYAIETYSTLGVPAGHPAGAAAGKRSHSDAGRQLAAAWEAGRAQAGDGGVAIGARGGQCEDARAAPQAGRFRFHQAVPVALLRVRRARQR